MIEIGYFGGTFNPIHNGHIKLAQAVVNKLGLDSVVFVPSGDSYQKKNVLPAHHRVAMVKAAIKDYPSFEINLMDVNRDGPTYTADTVKTIIAQTNGVARPYWIMGADAFLAIETYKNYEYILRSIPIIVAMRGIVEENVFKKAHEYTINYGATILMMGFDDDTSSTKVREQFENGKGDEANVPERVRDYIMTNKLYEKFDPMAAKERIVEWIRNKVNGFGEDYNCVIGISGGKDSTVAAALCVEALGANRVYGVMMPDGTQKDIADSEEVIEILGIHKHYYNIGPVCDMMRSICATEQARINLPPRIRMTTLYAIAQSLGKAFVINTCNLSEDYVGYSTWHGDSAGDFSPLSQYTSEEVMLIGDACGMPRHLTHKTPADGLCGKTDEDNLGFTYHELNEYIRGREEPRPDIKAIIDKKHKANLFKLQPLDSCPYYIEEK